MCGHKESFTPRPGGKFVYVGLDEKHYDAECLGYGEQAGNQYPIMLIKKNHGRTSDDIGFTGHNGKALGVGSLTFGGRFYDALEEKTWSAMVYINLISGQPGLTSIFPGTSDHLNTEPYRGRLEFITAGNEIKSVNYIPNTKKG